MITSEALKVPSPMSSTPELLGLPPKVAKDLPMVGSCWLFALSRISNIQFETESRKVN
jgi:hypothetical protein